METLAGTEARGLPAAIGHTPLVALELGAPSVLPAGAASSTPRRSQRSWRGAQAGVAAVAAYSPSGDGPALFDGLGGIGLEQAPQLLGRLLRALDEGGLIVVDRVLPFEQGLVVGAEHPHRSFPLRSRYT